MSLFSRQRWTLMLLLAAAFFWPEGTLTPELAKLKAESHRAIGVDPAASGKTGRTASAPGRAASPATSQELADKSPDDLAKLAIDRMSSGDLDGATAALSASQLASTPENGKLRSAFYELRLQRLIAAARARDCNAVADQMARLTDPDPLLLYTRPGGQDYLETPHALFYIGRTYGFCGKPKEALATWKRAAHTRVDADSPDAVFPMLARIQLAAFDEKPIVPMLQKGLQEWQARLKAATPETKPGAHYQVGILMQALGQFGDSDDHLEQAAEGTGMVRCWARVGLRDNDLARKGIK